MMKLLNASECQHIHGGTVIMTSPTDFVITGASTLVYGNVTFRYNSICQGNTCYQNSSNPNLTYTFSNFLIEGQSTWTVATTAIDGGGTVYHLS
jgi:hypothetical protein